MKTAAFVASKSGALLPLKPSVPSHQNPGTLLPMDLKTKVPPLNPGTLSQRKAGTMRHVILLHSKPGASSQPKLDAPSHPQPRVLISQSSKSLPQPDPGVSTLQMPKFLLHTRPHRTCHTLKPRSSYLRPLKSRHFLNQYPTSPKLHEIIIFQT